MKKSAIQLFFFVLCSFPLVFIQGQEIESLNRFQYINVPPLKYTISNPKTGSMTTVYDIYGVQAIISKTLKASGIEVLQNSSHMDDEMRMNCRIGHCDVYHASELDPDIIDGIIITFSDCNYNTVYTCQAKVKSMAAKRVTTAIAAGISPIKQATHEALSEFSLFKYQYDENNPVEKIESRVMGMNKKEIIAHFKSQENDFDQIEGVYVSTDVDAYFVELAIMKTDKKHYIFTFIDSQANEYFTIEFKKKLPK